MRSTRSARSARERLEVEACLRAGTVERRCRGTDTVMAMTTPATLERRRFADLLTEVGPDAPTLCDGWTTRDLAAHVVLRERRPDAALGVVISRLSAHTSKVQSKIADGDWDAVVASVRTGPPRWSPTRIQRVDRLVNTTEFFVHLEDVRRARPDWTVRSLPDGLVDDLESALRRSAKMFARKSPAGIVLEPDGGRHRITANDDTPAVTVRGPVGELVMWMFGRQEHAQVTYDGADESIDALRRASFGI